MASSNVSGMAASIRAATESETFDLAGNNKSTVSTTIQSAFTEPLPLTEMIRITFITGAGKLGRSRYDENCHKTVTSALRDQGYEEDRAASCVNECAGSFKSQHDTGKNLKTIVVFPKIFDESAMGDLNLEGGGGGYGDNGGGEPVLEKNSPKSMMAMSSIQVFTRMLSSKCQSWSQKKLCAVAIGEIKEIVESLDAKLLSGVPLNDSEQEFYDDVSLDSLSQKEAMVKTEMQQHVEEGKITRLEKTKLLTQVQEKIDALEKNISEATEEKKPKKVQKLTLQKDKVVEREKMLSNITPTAPHALKHELEIRKLRKEMQPLLKLEKETKGRLLSLKETTTLARKDEIEEEIEILEYKSLGWFEEEEEFRIRVDASRAISNARQAKKKVASKKSASTSSSGNSGKKAVANWVTPGARKRQVSKPVASGKPGGSNMFSAMMMDSDSD
mmetsp:Transcript_32933/g.39465  ORF Transcript_32933/g.39465 Transcript_32933/m.39465 type:complete len:444 (+) Transcript_32933:55-1386(+)|eukprot:CAMPEP_0198256398 /NCGR_PEP_ID=MMETSP1447-20131203/6324_1 /TAXON_ID=420782 /ORGANISM="Chaetoceros dichaeta, Strain CCMP1751" /LENGTH=443 /DNA_ID=CAMNT_0043943043 /DNA_START=33 /DNA_END=1364 /DNA_ORIENTATION=-